MTKCSTEYNEDCKNQPHFLCKALNFVCFKQLGAKLIFLLFACL